MLSDCVCVCSLNGPNWLPSEWSMICSEHFLEIKSVDDPSFLPGLFPASTAESMNAEVQGTEKCTTEKDVSCDFSVLEKVADSLPVLSAVDQAGAGPSPVHGRSDTSRLQKAFRELASHVCRLLVAHDSELLIEGTVGVTVDGGARVMLLHFADQVRKTEASTAEQNIENSASESTAVGGIFHDEPRNDAKVAAVNKIETCIRSPEEMTPADGDADCGAKLPSFASHSSQHSSASSKILSDLAQQMTNAMYTNSSSHDDAATLSTHKRKAELDNSSIGDRPKQQTLLRELLCAPLPPKRPCRPVNAAAAAATTGPISEVMQPRRPTANSSVLGGLLRTGHYQRDSNFSPVGSMYGREVRPKHEPGTLTQLSYGSQHLGVDVQGPQFGGNAVRALLKLASEHAASGRHDLLRNTKHRESATFQCEGFVNDGLADAEPDQRFRVQQRNQAGGGLSSTAYDFISTSQNIERSDSTTAVTISSELAPLTVKQEIVDPNYD